MTPTAAHISIAVYSGQPVDYSKYRHTALWIRFQDGSESLLAHVTGFRGEYSFQHRVGYDPQSSRSFVGLVDVGILEARTTSEQLTTALAAMPVDNRDPEFNRQTWIEATLKTLRDRHLLSEEAYWKGLDGMVDLIAEAEDEE